MGTHREAIIGFALSNYRSIRKGRRKDKYAMMLNGNLILLKYYET